MRLETLEPQWREAFALSWSAYIDGTTPIAAVICDAEGGIVSTARNAIRSESGAQRIAGHTMAHAEINAILALNEFAEHPGIRTYTLYTTMEPCPLCFGAIVMGSIRNFVYAARDPHAGSAKLVDASAYIRGKRISARGPVPELEPLFIALHSCYHSKRDRVTDSFRQTCPEGVEAGLRIAESGEIERLRGEGAAPEEALALLCRALYGG